MTKRKRPPLPGSARRKGDTESTPLERSDAAEERKRKRAKKGKNKKPPSRESIKKRADDMFKDF
mgnify:CR=1 FL=1